jgi:hypothetical protein
MSSGTALSAVGAGSGFNYTFFATETTTKGKNGSTLTFVSVTTCTGPSDQTPFNCLTASGGIEGGVLTRRQNIDAVLNIPDAVAAGFSFQACDEFTCFSITPPSPFPIKVTLRTNGLFTNEFRGITRQTQKAGVATMRFSSDGWSTNRSASVEGSIGTMTLPVFGGYFESAVISDARDVIHVIQRETMQ